MKGPEEWQQLQVQEALIVKKYSQYLEAKADLEAIRYEIARILLYFSKPVEQSDLQELLEETVLLIEEKEETEEKILKDYYKYQAEYNYLLHHWRNKVFHLIESNPNSQFHSLFLSSSLLGWNEPTTINPEPTFKGQIIPLSSLSFNDSGLLGSGAFGSVYRGTLFHSPCAIKTLHLSVHQKFRPEVKENFKAEIQILSNLQHDRVLRFFGACLETDQSYLVTEFLPNGSAADRLFPPLPSTPKGSKRNLVYYELSPTRKISLIRGIVEGMLFLHSNQVIHYDLKPENILLDDSLNPVIADFGLSRVLSLDDIFGLNKSARGTLSYMAPETLQEEPQMSGKVDIYAFGLMIYEFWVQKRWDWGVHRAIPLLQLLEKNIRPDLKTQRVTFPPDLKNLIEKWFFYFVIIYFFSWATLPSQRPEFSEMSNLQLEQQDGFQLRRHQPSHHKTDIWTSITKSIAFEEAGTAQHVWDGMSEGESSLSWKDFVTKFGVACGVGKFKAEELIILKAACNILDEIEIISRNQFIEFAKVFGSKPDLPAIIQLFHEPWFFGSLDPNQAVVILTQKEYSKSNRFLIRLSSSLPGTFVLSAKASASKSKDQPLGGHFTLHHIDYQQLSQAMKKGLLQTVFKGKPEAKLKWKPAKGRPPIIVVSCNQYNFTKKGKTTLTVGAQNRRGYLFTQSPNVNESTLLDEFRSDFWQ